MIYCKHPVFLKILLKFFQMNRIDERKYKRVHAAIFFTLQLTALKVLRVSLFFFFPVRLTFCSCFNPFFLCSVCTLFTRIEPFFFIAHIPQAFIHSYKASCYNSSCKTIYFCLISGDRVIVCCPVTSYFIIYICIYCFWCRTPRRWVNPSEWNHRCSSLWEYI